MPAFERMTKDELEAYAKQEFGVDLHKGLSKAHMIQEIEAMATPKPQKPAAAPAPKTDPRWKGLTLQQQETLVQIVAKMVRSGHDLDPDGKPAPGAAAVNCGYEYGNFPMIDEGQRDAAYEEAKARSPAFDHYTIAAKSRWPEKDAGSEG